MLIEERRHSPSLRKMFIFFETTIFCSNTLFSRSLPLPIPGLSQVLRLHHFQSRKVQKTLPHGLTVYQQTKEIIPNQETRDYQINRLLIHHPQDVLPS